MRVLAIGALALLTSCAPAPAPKQPPKRDPTLEAWYGQSVQQLTSIDRQAESLFRSGKSDEASALIQKGEPLMERLLAVPRPTLEATEAASDLDQLYGRMLFANRHYGWARLQFQKNLVRWKYWQPQTPDSLQRLQQAKAAIDDCDRKLLN